MDGNLTGINFNLFDSDNDNDGFQLAWLALRKITPVTLLARQLQCAGEPGLRVRLQTPDLTYSILPDICWKFRARDCCPSFPFHDFENPDDNNSDNRYEATVQVSDGNASAILNVVVEVTDEVETVPERGSAVSVRRQLQCAGEPGLRVRLQCH